MVSEVEIQVCAAALAAAASSPATIVLFGSYGRGTPTPSSDLDFLVVEDRVDSRHAEAVHLREALPALDTPVDVIAMSKADAASRARVRGTVVATALREGRVLVAA